MYKIITCLSLFTLYLIAPIAAADPTIFIYSDEGAGKESMQQTRLFLQQKLSGQLDIRFINADEVIQGNWKKTARLFIMPGGADIPYTRKLNGKGNQHIKDFVAHGGAYLGICAGSYYGANYVEFDKNGPLEVLGPRELSFYNGKAVGPALAPYRYNSYEGARAATLTPGSIKFPKTTSYYNGGSYFPNADAQPNVQVLAYYSHDKPAIIYTPYGKGHVVLSGAHFEYNPRNMPTDIELKSIIQSLEATEASREILTDIILQKLSLLNNSNNKQKL